MPHKRFLLEEIAQHLELGKLQLGEILFSLRLLSQYQNLVTGIATSGLNSANLSTIYYELT